MSACKYCQANLVAFMHHELSPLNKNQVALHLDKCTTCYAIYLREQNLAQDLAQMIPLVGQGHQPAIHRVWAAIQNDLAHPRRPVHLYSAHYGLVALMVTLMLLVPLTTGNQSLPLVSPATQPPPVVQATPSSTENAVAYIPVLHISLTPEAKTPVITGPSPDAITTP